MGINAQITLDVAPLRSVQLVGLADIPSCQTLHHSDTLDRVRAERVAVQSHLRGQPFC